jgi:hypothetical protein
MLQIIVIKRFMLRLMGGKKDAKKFKKNLYNRPEKGQDVARCLPKAQSKKDAKNH